MRPKPFRPEPLVGVGVESCVRDRTTGLVWHRCQQRTLYADTDRSQVVYHANYLRYFEFGRASLMRDAGYTYKDVEASGFLYPIIATALEYFSPLTYDDGMHVHTRPSALERVKVQFDYVITHAEGGALACTGFTRHCAVNARGIPVGIDEKTLRLWASFPR